MAIRKNKKRIDPRYFLDEKMQIPAPVIKKCLAWFETIGADISDQTMTHPGGGPYRDSPSYKDRSSIDVIDDHTAREEAERNFKDNRCEATLERAEQDGRLDHVSAEKWNGRKHSLMNEPKQAYTRLKR